MSAFCGYVREVTGGQYPSSTAVVPSNVLDGLMSKRTIESVRGTAQRKFREARIDDVRWIKTVSSVPRVRKYLMYAYQRFGGTLMAKNVTLERQIEFIRAWAQYDLILNELSVYYSNKRLRRQRGPVLQTHPHAEWKGQTEKYSGQTALGRAAAGRSSSQCPSDVFVTNREPF